MATIAHEIDMVIAFDTTQSMHWYIANAINAMQKVIDMLAKKNLSIRFSVVLYRDYDQDRAEEYVVKTLPFTPDVYKVKRYLQYATAAGGQDGPEAVDAAMKAILDADWRPKAQKMAVIVADAPPHALGPDGQGDYFPTLKALKGAGGHDPVELTAQLSRKGIAVFSAICGNIGMYARGTSFFARLSARTNGQCIRIKSAEKTSETIVACAMAEYSSYLLSAKAAELEKKVRAELPDITTEEMFDKLEELVAEDPDLEDVDTLSDACVVGAGYSAAMGAFSDMDEMRKALDSAKFEPSKEETCDEEEYEMVRVETAPGPYLTRSLEGPEDDKLPVTRSLAGVPTAEEEDEEDEVDEESKAPMFTSCGSSEGATAGPTFRSAPVGAAKRPSPAAATTYKRVRKTNDVSKKGPPNRRMLMRALEIGATA